jgi:hypothetical protein
MSVILARTHTGALNDLTNVVAASRCVEALRRCRPVSTAAQRRGYSTAHLWNMFYGLFGDGAF